MSSKTMLIGILVAVGGLAAAAGSALLPPGVGQLAVGTVGLILVLAALAMLVVGWSPTGRARAPGAPVKTPPPELEDDQQPSPEADAPSVNSRP